MSFLEELSREPYRFDFYDVLRRFERSHPEKPRIGESAARDEEFLLLSQEPYAEFPASNLSKFEQDGSGRSRLRSRFLGLLGPQGALPLHTTMEAKEWSDRHDHSFVRFLDIFNHRFLQLFFRAWANARPAAQRDRPADDRFAGFVGAACGMGTEPFLKRDSVGDLAKLALAGLLGPSVKCASRIESFLAYLFNAKVEVEQFAGSWLVLAAEERSTIGGRHARLGQDTMIGGASYSVQDKFRIRIAALSLAQFETFLPDGGFCERLADIIYFYVGAIMDYDVELSLPAAETRPVSLGNFGRLGWTSWMRDKDGEQTGLRRDCRFRPEERAAVARAKQAGRQDDG